MARSRSKVEDKDDEAGPDLKVENVGVWDEKAREKAVTNTARTLPLVTLVTLYGRFISAKTRLPANRGRPTVSMSPTRSMQPA